MVLDQSHADDPGLVGRTVAGTYRVTERAGSAPQGPLYEAEGPDGRRVLVLVLESPAPGREPPGVQSFRRAAGIRHPNVAAVHAVGPLEDGSAYVVLEDLAGEPLLQLLGARKALPLGEALGLAVQAAEGLEAVHQAGFVHGNVSPSSILVTRLPYGTSQVKLVRFSLAPDGRVAIPLEDGSAEYASPERVDGNRPDQRCDVFSLGAVLHHLLSGRPPGRTRAVGAVPKIARPVLETALAPLPSARFQTMSEFREALEQLVAAIGMPRRALLPRKLLVRAAVAGLVVVAGVLLVAPVWKSLGTSLSQAVTMRVDTQASSVSTRPSKQPDSGAASADSEGRRARVGRASRSSKVATAEPDRSSVAETAGAEQEAAAPDPVPAAASRDRPSEERVEAPDAAGYVAQASGPEVPAEPAESPRPVPAPRAKSNAPVVVRGDPPRPRIVLEEDQGLRQAIGDVMRIGLAENVVEMSPGLLVVQLAEGGMEVPSASYNLQRLYLAYSAATRQQDTVALELRRKGELHGWFTREGFRGASSHEGRP
jgi:hypothetical protein